MGWGVWILWGGQKLPSNTPYRPSNSRLQQSITSTTKAATHCWMLLQGASFTVSDLLLLLLRMWESIDEKRLRNPPWRFISQAQKSDTSQSCQCNKTTQKIGQLLIITIIITITISVYNRPFPELFQAEQKEEKYGLVSSWLLREETMLAMLDPRCQ